MIAFQGEVMLLDWSETAKGGRKIVLGLDAEGDTHPFALARTRQGRQSGQRYAIVMVEIGEDERPVEKTHAQMAFLLCKDPTFWHFLNERSLAVIDSEEAAKAHVLEGTGATSRSEFDKDPAKRSAWLTVFYNPWTAYKAANLQRML